jgi:hypothetical protein
MLSPSLPDNPWMSEFHAMRGLFISGAEAGGQGPQIENATAGDKLLLQARVYNYSFATMSSDTKVHVRFYGQPWNNNANRPTGDSFLIGEDVTSPIPPFNTDTASPNSGLVQIPAPFDTTPYADQYLTFWVVVWMEDRDGNLSAFYVFPAPSNTAEASAEEGSTASRRRRPVVRLRKVEASSHLVSHGERTIVSTTLHTGDQAIKGGLTLRFYEGDPAEADRSFHLERVVHLRADDTYDVRVPFRSDVCGLHKLVVVAGRGTAFEQQRQAHIWVRCDHDRPHLPQRSAR